jgi:cytoskeletal protein RodZ
MNHQIMIYTIFSALAGILIFAIWSNNNFYVYAQQSYSPSMPLTNSTGNRSNATTTANTPIGQQQQTTSMSSSSSGPSIQSQQSSPSSPITTDDGGFSAGLRDGKAQGFIDAKKGIDKNQCGLEHSNSYCAGYKIGYRLTLRPYL